MYIIAWTILVLGLLGFFAVLIINVPQALQRPIGRAKVLTVSDGLVSYLRQKLKAWSKKTWHFILEAKDLHPGTALQLPIQQVKKVFKVRVKENQNEPDWMPEVSHEVEQAPNRKTAEEVYMDAIKRDPSDREAYEGLGRLYLQEKNWTDAAETFRFLAKLDPSKDIYWSNLGLTLYSVKDYQGAVSAYEKALNINGKIPVRWINLALCFDALDETGKAIKAVASALNLDPRNMHYMNLLSDLYIKAENKVRAEEVLEEMLSLDPHNKHAREKLMKLRI